MTENNQEVVIPVSTTTPSGLSREEKTWAMLCHLAGFVLFIPLGNVLAPLVLWLTKKHTSGFINDQGREAVNFQVSVLIGLAVAFFLWHFLFFLGLALILAIVLFDIVMMINGANGASEGHWYRYPYTFRFIK